MGRLSTLTHLITSITIFFSCIAGSCAFGSPYVYTGDSKIPTEHFEYLEGLDNDAPLSALQEGDWNKKIQDIVKLFIDYIWVDNKIMCALNIRFLILKLFCLKNSYQILYEKSALLYFEKS